MSETGGGRANQSGRSLEKMVEGLLLGHGYGKVSKREIQKHIIAGEPVFTTQYMIGQTIYNTDLKIDFFVYHPSKFPDGLIIECKWQQAGGSVDGKYPYLVANLLKNQKASVIVLDGDGYRPGAKRWLEDQALKNDKLRVFDLISFTQWANSGSL
ncbi:MAG: PD-(D/E)XK nuclease superfamily protein [Pseudomonadota bacterium]|nr:PD-(D/E)XK nuclease superfamily protein [Pseudomonadota bacterium]